MWHKGILSLAYLTVNGADPVQHIEAAAAAGYQAAGLRIFPPRHLRNSPAVVGNAALIREVKRASKRDDITLLDAEVASLASTTTRDELAAMVDTAAELGFRVIQTVCEDPDETRAADQLGVLADLAATAQLGIALEFMKFRSVSNLQQALRLIELCGRSNVQLVIDALHLARSGGSAADLISVAPRMIAVAQLCDAPVLSPDFDGLATEARTARLYPGEGGLELCALLDALPDDLPLSIEVPNTAFEQWNHVERARRAMHATRQLLTRREAAFNR